MLGGEQPALSNFRVLAMQAAHFASNERIDLARLLADQALEFASKAPVFEKHQESAADRDLKGLLMAIRSATPTPTRGLKRSWGTGSFSFRIQAGTASFITIALVGALISGAHITRI